MCGWETGAAEALFLDSVTPLSFDGVPSSNESQPPPPFAKRESMRRKNVRGGNSYDYEERLDRELVSILIEIFKCCLKFLWCLWRCLKVRVYLSMFEEKGIWSRIEIYCFCFLIEILRVVQSSRIFVMIF